MRCVKFYLAPEYTRISLKLVDSSLRALSEAIQYLEKNLCSRNWIASSKTPRNDRSLFPKIQMERVYTQATANLGVSLPSTALRGKVALLAPDEGLKIWTPHSNPLPRLVLRSLLGVVGSSREIDKS